jgi:nucleoside-diphosphate-sugar epimerase
MALTNTFCPRALVHSSGSAARIARYPLDFVVGDVCDPEFVNSAMMGCDVVVHLARGTDQVMTRGLENVLRAARRHGIQRVVHVSSVAVFGDQPPDESRLEGATPRPGTNQYGSVKLAQEARVLRHARKYGLPTVILRPPHIYGPFAHFTVGLINRLRDRSLPLVDGGSNPCNLVYVDNFVQAILLALTKREAINEVFFVTDRDRITWKQCLEDHAALVGAPVARATAEELVPQRPGNLLIDSLRATPQVLVSEELRAVLRQIPLVESIEKFAWKWFDSRRPQLKERIRLRIQGPRVVAKSVSGPSRIDATDNFILAQGRTVDHSCEKACRLLGYTAPISYQEAMDVTVSWLRFARLVA